MDIQDQLNADKDDDQSDESGIEETKARGGWSRPFEYILSLLGLFIGIGNLLRFPYLTMQNGGGAFLIPYMICLFLFGVPLCALESVIGQYTKQGCISCWNTYAPLVKGMGYGMVIMCMMWLVYYQAYFGWTIYYLAASFSWPLPWASCNSTWNTDNCVVTVTAENLNVTDQNHEYTNLTQIYNITANFTKPTSAAEEYWRYNVLQISDGINDLAGLRWQIVVTYVVGWLVVYLCCIRGVKSSSKVIYVTATAPYIFILIFVIRAALLPGSLKGIKYYLIPDFDLLRTPQVWIQAFIQNFFTLGISWGSIQTMSSYNDFHHKLYREVFIAPVACCFTSFLAGFSVFSMVGFLSEKTGVPVSEAVSSGPGLAFITYPEVIVHLPASPIWSVAFFLMLIMVAIDTQFVVFETSLSALGDEWNLNKRHRFCLTTIIACMGMVIGLVFCTRGGVYVFHVIDSYIATVTPFVFSVIECVAVVWYYRRVFDDVETMTGWRPPKWLFVPLWGVLTPIVLVAVGFWSLYQMSPPTYDGREYPDWIHRLGWLITFVGLLPLPTVALCKVISASGSTWREKLHNASKAKACSLSQEMKGEGEMTHLNSLNT